MNNSSNLINHGLSNSYINYDDKEWTYDQGVIQEGFADFTKRIRTQLCSLKLRQSQLDDQQVPNNEWDSGGSDVTGRDAPQFKIIFMWNLILARPIFCTGEIVSTRDE
jgi:hypothetical protein